MDRTAASSALKIWNPWDPEATMHAWNCCLHASCKILATRQPQVCRCATPSNRAIDRHTSSLIRMCNRIGSSGHRAEKWVPDVRTKLWIWISHRRPENETDQHQHWCPLRNGQDSLRQGCPGVRPVGFLRFFFLKKTEFGKHTYSTRSVPPTHPRRINTRTLCYWNLLACTTCVSHPRENTSTRSRFISKDTIA